MGSSGGGLCVLHGGHTAAAHIIVGGLQVGRGLPGLQQRRRAGIRLAHHPGQVEDVPCGKVQVDLQLTGLKVQPIAGLGEVGEAEGGGCGRVGGSSWVVGGSSPLSGRRAGGEGGG